MRKLILYLLLIFTLESYGQCTMPINSNSGIGGNNGSSPYAGSPYYMYAFLGTSCAGYTGPSIPNWFSSSYTADAVAGSYVSSYIYRNVPFPKEFYENFYTTADLMPFQPNTTYFYSFEVAMKNLHGISNSKLEVINSANTVGFNNNCTFFSGIDPPMAPNGPVLFTEIIPKTSTPNVPPVFIKICGNFTTGPSLSGSNIIWFRFTFETPSLTEEQQNYHYIKNFKIFPCAAPNVQEHYDCCPSLQLGNDTSICDEVGNDMLLTIKNDIFDSYIWHDASNNNSFLLTTLNRTFNDIYWVEGKFNNCLASRDSIKVDYINCCYNQLSLGKDSIVCDTSQITLQPTGDTFDNYVWQDASNTNSFVLTPLNKTLNNIYWIEGQVAGCPSVRDSIEINFIDCCALEQLDIGKDRTYCTDTEVILKTNIDFQTYLWQNGSTNSNYIIVPSSRAENNIYWVEVTSDCGTKRDSIKIEFVIEEDIFIQNLITPNSDGKNDLFEISKGNTVYKVSIYNRWGNIVYQNYNYDNSWNGEGLTEGIYYYIIENITCQYQYKGWLQLLR